MFTGKSQSNKLAFSFYTLQSEENKTYSNHYITLSDKYSGTILDTKYEKNTTFSGT